MVLSEITTVSEFKLFPINKQPIVISGPCSAENEEMFFETATQLKEIGVNVVRAGLWKPRTRPNSFEGVGEKGLPWLKRVQEELGMKVGIEVAKVEHVDLALKAGLDFFWIGARTTPNPFAVQDIADALRGVDTPILVKNPISPDLEAWMGAIERFYAAGARNIGVIHRGFCTYEAKKYRNDPLWEIVLALKKQLPAGTLFICDPSHIAGNKEYLEEISKKALSIGFDGLMIETHPTPELALSDSKQQIIPAELNQLLSRL